MNIVSLGIGVVIGLVGGSLLTMLYIQWKMRKQVSALEQNLGDLMDVTEEMEEGEMEMPMMDEEVPEKGPEEEKD
ncbi:MAG: hypothetical protein ABEK01_01765 [Candidatus Nanohaloarchaea archaeon]